MFWRDLALAGRAGGAAMLGLMFFLAVVAVIPFGVGPDLNLLGRIGPAVLWIGALLASLLGLDRLFQADREDGGLDLIVLQDFSDLVLTVLVKTAAHWVITGLPLVVAAPLLALMMNVEPLAGGAVMATLLVGTPAVALVGAAGAAIAVSLPRGGLLVSVLILPLCVPVLIFGISSARAAVTDPDPFWPPFLILSAITLVFAVIGPVAAALALRASSD
nr:heme exporter protein CcmB [Pseudohoeflea sp. DP4N28-3]